MRTSASQTPPTKYQAFLEERGQLLSKNFTGTKRERQIGNILVPNTAKMDNWIPYGFEVLALKVQNEQREPPLLPGTLKETNQQSAGLVREAVYGKAASIPNRYLLSDSEGHSRSTKHRICGSSDAFCYDSTFSYSEVDNNTWRHNMWRTSLWGRDILFFRLLAMVLWDNHAPRTCGNCCNHCSAMWNLLTSHWMGYMQIPRAHQDRWTKGFLSWLHRHLTEPKTSRQEESINRNAATRNHVCSVWGRTRSKSPANEKELHQHDKKTCVYCMSHAGHSKVLQSKWHSSRVCRNTG